MQRAYLVLSATLFVAHAVSEVESDRTITNVVKLLQSMLDKSKADGGNERTMYGKYKCYCDSNEAEKTESIKQLGAQISMLGSQITGLQSKNGILSAECDQLQESMKANEQSRIQAQSIRDNENQEFLSFEADSVAANSSMTEAIDTLAAVGADQTLEQSAADHKQFMSNYNGASLLKLRKIVKQALLASASFTSHAQNAKMESFLQTPFTGTYTAQAGEVVGILKDMRDTFEANLASARDAEAKASAAHQKYMKEMNTAYGEMEESNEAKQDLLSDNDGALASKKQQRDVAETQKTDDETFLAALKDMCAAKNKDYGERTLLRKNEEAAIAEAIAILNSDQAFETFGKVDATKTGATSLFQRREIRQHGMATVDATRLRASRILRKAAAGHKHSFVTKVVAMLEAGPNHAFTVVLDEIAKMITLIGEEQKADDAQFSWCDDERQKNNLQLSERNAQIILLDTAITDLNALIDNPTTGLKTQIQGTETAIEDNDKAQTTETADRKEANAAYTEDIHHIVEATQLLTNAVSVLQKYYAKILKQDEALIQAKEEPAPPSSWENDSFKGQSAHGGTNAIDMLEFILGETKKEENTAHTDEATAQAQFEDSMKQLTDEEASLKSTLATLRETLAEKEEELLAKKKDLSTTTADKEAIEAYLLNIKPGCDFITEEIVTRTSNRNTEKGALEQAATLLRGTEAFQAAMATKHDDELGDCLAVCKGAEEHVTCKACLAKVTEPAYCAGHAMTQGC